MTDPFADLTPAQRQQIWDAHAAAKEAQQTDLTLDEVRRQADAILDADRDDSDPEGTHAEQDDLYERVLRAVADGHPDGRAMAAECVRVAESDGTRWYA